MLLLLAMFFFLFLPPQRKSNASELSISELHTALLTDEKYVDTQEAVYKIMQQDRNFILIDVRDSADFQQFSLPGAIHMTIQDITGRRYRQFFADNQAKKVFYSFGESQALMAWATATRAGMENVYLLKGGLNGLFEELFEAPVNLEEQTDMTAQFRARFIAKARQMFMEGEALPKAVSTPVPVKTLIEIQTPGGRGGC